MSADPVGLGGDGVAGIAELSNEQKAAVLAVHGQAIALTQQIEAAYRAEVETLKQGFSEAMINLQQRMTMLIEQRIATRIGSINSAFDGLLGLVSGAAPAPAAPAVVAGSAPAPGSTSVPVVD